MARQKLVYYRSKLKGVRYREHPTRKHNRRPDRCYVVDVRIDGNQKTKTIGWASEGWTEDKAFAKRMELLEKKGEDLTFTRYFEDIYYPYQESMLGEDRSYREWQLFKDYIKPVVGSKPLEEITFHDLLPIRKRMELKKLAPRTIHYAFAVVRQAFNHAIPEYVKYSPVITRKLTRGLRLNNERRRFLAPEEAKKLLEALCGRSVQLYEMALVALLAGLRAGEIFNLQWKDINVETINVLDGKGHDRTVWMSPELVKMFSKKERRQPFDFVFVPTKNGVLKPERAPIKQVSQAFRQEVNNRPLQKSAFSQPVS